MPVVPLGFSRNVRSVAPLPPMHQQTQGNRPNYAPGITQQQDLHIPPSDPDQCSSFRLKWVVRTHVSRCYGCNSKIKNPPESIPDELLLFTATIDNSERETRVNSSIQIDRRTFTSILDLHVSEQDIQVFLVLVPLSYLAISHHTFVLNTSND